MRYGIVASICVLLLLLGVSEAAPGEDFKVRVDGKVLRTASGKLVLSLSSFELSGMREVMLENRKTGEKKTVTLSSIYPDICYTEHLSEDILRAAGSGDWFPYVIWATHDDPEALRARLTDIYAYQNRLRLELGNAVLEEGGGSGKVSSRLTLNKIEKFHRIAAAIAEEALKLARERDELGAFLAPLSLRIGYNTFAANPSGSPLGSLHDVRDIIYWEVHRVLTLQYGVDESMVDFVFDAPSTIREFIPIDPSKLENMSEFHPGVTVEGAAIYCALYLQRQDFESELKELVRVKEFRDPFIKDRSAVDRFVNEGKVVGVHGNRVAVTFAPPFAKTGEVLLIALDPEGKEVIPAVLQASVPDGGYSLTGELPAESIARVRPGMPVRRK